MRRYPDFRALRPHWSTGDAFVAAIGVVAGLALIAAVITLAGSQVMMLF